MPEQHVHQTTENSASEETDEYAQNTQKRQEPTLNERLRIFSVCLGFLSLLHLHSANREAADVQKGRKEALGWPVRLLPYPSHRHGRKYIRQQHLTVTLPFPKSTPTPYVNSTRLSLYPL